MARWAFAIEDLSPERALRWSQLVLSCMLALGIGFILLSTWLSTELLFLVTGALLGGFVLAMLARDEVVLLSAILAGFIAAARHEEGFQIEEILYGLIYLSYLTYWFVSRLFFYRDDILRTKVDWALFLFLAYVTCSLVLTPILDGDMAAALSEWLSISMLAFYFPIKEICIRQRHRIPQKPILLSLSFVGVFIAIRNVLDYRRGLGEADYLWQIASGRVVLNEHVLMLAGVGTLAFMIHSATKRHFVLFGTLFTIFGTGVLIGQSRAVWVSFALGMAVIFLFVEQRKRIQIVIAGTVGLAFVLLMSFLYFDNFFNVMFAGFADRLFSLRTAIVEDISLINRFVEIEAAWEHIKRNPIVGYGFGVPIRYYSLVYEATRVNSFIHNGFVGVLYRHGLIGFGLLYFYFFGSIWLAFRTVRMRPIIKMDYVIALAAVACLVAESLAGTTENPFATSDKTFIIAAITGLAAATYESVRRENLAPFDRRT
jgi:O-antigen ligase